MRRYDGAVACRLCGVITAAPSDLDSGVCGACARERPAYDQVAFYGAYQGPLRRLIHVLKYDRVASLARPLGERLAALAGELAPFDVVVPTPLDWRRRWRRGFNQAGLLAERVAGRLTVPYKPHLLRRKLARAQARLTSAERRRNLRGAVRARRPEEIAGRTVLVVDDVMTTGATLDACARALKRAGAKSVKGLILARAERLRPAG